MKKFGSLALAAALSLSCLGAAACGEKEETLYSPDNPVTITVWNYYTGKQLAAFNDLVKQFNDGQGEESGIVVEGKSQSSIANLESAVIASAKKQAGAEDLPNVFAGYSDLAYTVDKMGLVADIAEYFTAAEKAEYVEGFLKEGDLDGNGSLKIFPIGKSTEIFMINKTDWDKFATENNKTYADLATIEKLTATAELYYEWSGGKALFGRDAMDNYMFIGAKQLGVELVSVQDGEEVFNFDKTTVKKLWDYYYVPFVKGYFAAVDEYRSSDVATGDILGFVGSSTSESFFPKVVYISDTESYAIEYDILEAPKFEGAANVAVQQGAGMVVTKSTEAEEAASVEFLKWFADVEQNVPFSINANYMPVKTSSITMVGALESCTKSLKTSIQTAQNNTMYTPPAVKSGSSVRTYLKTCMSTIAETDREAAFADESKLTEFTSSAYFDAWYEATKAELERIFNAD